MIKNKNKTKYYVILFFIIFLNFLPNFNTTLKAQCAQTYKYLNFQNLSNQTWKYSFYLNDQNVSQNISDNNWETINITSNWKKLKSNPNSFQIWLRCTIVVDKEILPVNSGIYINKLEVADKVFFNGTLIGGSGDAEKKINDYTKERLYSIPNFLWQRGANIITINLKGTYTFQPGLKIVSLVEENFISKVIFTLKIPFILLSFGFYLLFFVIILFYINLSFKIENLLLGLISFCLGSFYISHFYIFSTLLFNFVIQKILLFLGLIFILEFFLKFYSLKRKRELKFIILYTVSLITATLPALISNKTWLWSNLYKFEILLISIFFIFIFNIVYFKNNNKNYKYLKQGFVFLLFGVLSDLIFTFYIQFIPKISILFNFTFIIFCLKEIIQDIDKKYLKITSKEIFDEIEEKRKINSIKKITYEFEYFLEELNKLLSKDNYIKNKQNILDLKSSVLGIERIFNDYDILQKLDTNSYIVKYHNIHLSDFISNIIEKVSIQTKQNKKRIVLDFKNKDQNITSDPYLLEIICFQILENALVHTQGKVLWKIEIKENLLEMNFIDEGPGVDDNKKFSIFEKYSNNDFDKTKTHSLGIGLGLYLVKKSIVLLNSKIVFKNNKGFFSDFNFILELK